VIGGTSKTEELEKDKLDDSDENPGICIVYRYEDGSFPVSANCVAISNPDSLSNSETRVNPGIRN
jgi:hypothetical protein